MKILVTGATGFIGNHVMERLIKTDNEIIATSRNKGKAKEFSWFENVKYIPCDLNERKQNYFEFFEQPDILIHLAWEGLPNYKELYHFEKNLPTNCYFIKNMVGNGLRDLNVTGTCFEYGMKSGPLSENMETNPITVYGLSKDSLRKYVQQLEGRYDFKFKWIRLFYIYGKGQNPNSLIPQLKRAIRNNKKVFKMSGGEQLRDYLHVKKVAEYIEKISLQNEMTGIINCCSGNPISIRKLVENYLNEMDKSIELDLGYYPYPDYVPMAFWGDNSKLKHILNNQN